METRPEPTPEGKLIDDAAALADISIREAARRAGLSYGRWRQITKGFQNMSPGVYAPVRDAPAKTIAKMARAVGVTPAQLAEAGREDAAVILARFQQPEPVTPESAFKPAADAPADPADDVTGAVVAALFGPVERRIWASIRRHLESTPVGAELLADPAQAAIWPPDSAPIDLTPEARELLDVTSPTDLFTDPGEIIVWGLSRLPYRKRVAMIREYRAPVRPTVAVRRAG